MGQSRTLIYEFALDNRTDAKSSLSTIGALGVWVTIGCKLLALECSALERNAALQTENRQQVP